MLLEWTTNEHLKESSRGVWIAKAQKVVQGENGKRNSGGAAHLSCPLDFAGSRNLRWKRGDKRKSMRD